MYAAHHLVKVRARKRRSRKDWSRSISARFFEGLLRHPVLTPKTVGAALVEVFTVILRSRRRLLSLMLLLISEASMVCVTLDVTAATTTTAAVMAPSILWASSRRDLAYAE